MKYLLIILLLLLTGCGTGVSPALLHKLNIACIDNEGFSHFSFANDYVTCIDGDKFQISEY